MVERNHFSNRILSAEIRFSIDTIMKYSDMQLRKVWLSILREYLITSTFEIFRTIAFFMQRSKEVIFQQIPTDSVRFSAKNFTEENKSLATDKF